MPTKEGKTACSAANLHNWYLELCRLFKNNLIKYNTSKSSENLHHRRIPSPCCLTGSSFLIHLLISFFPQIKRNPDFCVQPGTSFSCAPYTISIRIQTNSIFDSCADDETSPLVINANCSRFEGRHSTLVITNQRPSRSLQLPARNHHYEVWRATPIQCDQRVPMVLYRLR